MQGLRLIRARRHAAQAIYAGAVLLASAAIVPAHATGGTETALAVPRIAPIGRDSETALPQPLNPSDATLVRCAFAAEARGNLAVADIAISHLQNDLLLGQIEAARYLGRFHHATAAELTAWLSRYAGEPDAAAIRALLRRRLPPGAKLPPLPADLAVVAAPRPPVAPAPPTRLSAGPAVPAGTVRALFTQNRDVRALAVAQRILHSEKPASRTGQAAYVGGLAAWRLGRIAVARDMFAVAAVTPDAPPRRLAAAAFWTARAAQRQHDPIAADTWLHRAANHPTTLHGMLARTLLGLPTGVPPAQTVVTPADIDAIAAFPGGWRAFALLEVGQPARAAAELRDLWPRVQPNPALRRALILVAGAAGLTDCAWQLAAWNAADPGAGAPVLPPLRPTGGFRVSPALVYAVTRVESNFDPRAVSSAGARGLMQIMPATAQYLSDGRLGSPARLHDPAVNLELGQRYLLLLAAQDGIGDDLLRLLASYNDGPGGFARWQGTLHDQGDPLLFIEAIPVDETRRFVQDALTYTWIYAARLDVPAPSLDAMAAGDFPRFTAGAGGSKIVAARLP